MYQIVLKNIIEKKYAAKKKKICNSFEMGEKVFVLVKRIKKNQHLENFIETVQNIPYFNKKTVFRIRRKQNIDKKTFIS